MKKIIVYLAAIIMVVLLITPVAFAGYKKYSGTYKGKWETYNMSCPSIYRDSNGIANLKIKVKKKGKFTGTIKFDGTPYKASGKIKKGKIKLHFLGYSSKYDYNGTIKGKKINMIAFNNDAAGDRLCLSGWKQRMRLSK
ncbi:MAG: hypothetical protein AB1465_04460 [Patescibacteria group bacterium]